MNFWRSHRYDLKILSRFAAHFLVTTATSVPSESAFSIASYLLRKQRSRLSPVNLSYSMFLKDKVNDTKNVRSESSETLQKKQAHSYWQRFHTLLPFLFDTDTGGGALFWSTCYFRLTYVCTHFCTLDVSLPSSWIAMYLFSFSWLNTLDEAHTSSSKSSLWHGFSRATRAKGKETYEWPDDTKALLCFGYYKILVKRLAYINPTDTRTSNTALAVIAD